MDLELNGKRAIVVGGSSGIGLAIATELSREGVNVAIVGRRGDRLDSASAIIREATQKVVLPVSTDICDDEAVRALVTRVIERFGGVDILVNSASENPGLSNSSENRPADFGYGEFTDDHFMRQFNIKVVGYLRMARAVAPFLVEQRWGRIINVGGISARRTAALVNARARGGVGNYPRIDASPAGCIEAGVTALTKNLADELGPHGVNVTAIYPGYTLTDPFKARLTVEAELLGRSFEEHIRTIDTGSAIARFVLPNEIGWVVAFLASPKSITISGTAIPVGGGFLGSIDY